MLVPALLRQQHQSPFLLATALPATLGALPASQEVAVNTSVGSRRSLVVLVPVMVVLVLLVVVLVVLVLLVVLVVLVVMKFVLA